MSTDAIDSVRGHKFLFHWDEGSTHGVVHEHHFHENGTVEWRDVAHAESGMAEERPPFAVLEVDPNVCLVSYQSKGGFTLTVALNFVNRRVVGVTSSAEKWEPVAGHFEVVS